MQQTSSSFRDQTNVFFYILVISIIMVGVILRASKYLPAWSMRGDELAVTENLIKKSWGELMTKPLDSNQAAPVGFLLLEKLLVSAFGPLDYILRLPAMLAGCIALILLYSLLHRMGESHGTVFALLALAFGSFPIYYSSELKQYSTDVLIALLLLVLVYGHLHKETKARDFLKLGVLGALAICFSHPAIFMLAVIGPILLVHHWYDSQKRWWTLLAGATWVFVFLILYWILLRHQTASEYLVTFWGNLQSYMPLRPWRNPAWFPNAWGHLLVNIAGFPRAAVLLLSVIYVVGVGSLLKARKWQWAAILVLPIAVNMIVSGFQKFPFHGRLILYLVPLVLVVLAIGIGALVRMIPNRMAANLVFAGIAAFSVSSAVSTANSYLITREYVVDDMKPVLAYMRDHAEKGDLAYLYHYAASGYAYYAPSYELGSIKTVRGKNHSQRAKRYDEELAALPRGQRIWFVFSFVYKTKVGKDNKMDERDYILSYLRENGTLVEESYSTNQASSTHLFILK